jgi:GTP pyrophosphokinase
MARESLDLCAAGQPPRHLAVQVGTGRPVLPLSGTGNLQAHREDARREALEREGFIASAVERLQSEMAAVGMRAEVYGRPKHIYSIWNKMRAKHLDFSEVYDVRALRIIVDEVQGLLHRAGHRASPLAADPRRVRRLHLPSQGQPSTARCTPPSKPKTAARWKCRSAPARCTSMPNSGWRRTGATRSPARRRRPIGAYDDKIAWLRQLLSWRDEIADSADLGRAVQARRAGRHHLRADAAGAVIDLPPAPRRSTLPTAAYRPRPSLPRRPRERPHGTPQQGAAKRPAGRDHHGQDGGPSRDWLNPAPGLPRHLACPAQGQAVVRGAGGSRTAGPGAQPS